MKIIQLLVAISALLILLPRAHGATTVPAITYYSLELNGTSVGSLRSLDGGDIFADVSRSRDGASTRERKAIGGAKYGDFTIQLGGGLGKTVYDWVSDTVDQLHPRMNGAVVLADSRLQPVQRTAFTKALISEITIPAADASTRTASYLGVKFVPELIRWLQGSDAKSPAPTAGRQKVWLASNFRLAVDGLDCTKVSRIDPIVITQTIETVGESAKRAGNVDYPNLHITMAESGARTWLDWAEDFMIAGRNDTAHEKEGTLTFLSSDLKEELIRVTFHNLGIFRVHRTLPLNDTRSTVTVDLYVESMEIDFMAQFER